MTYLHVLCEGQETRRCDCEMYHSPAAGLPTSTVQTGPEAGEAAGCPHPDQARHHLRPVAVHQDAQAAGPTREGVRQLRPVSEADIPN